MPDNQPSRRYENFNISRYFTTVCGIISNYEPPSHLLQPLPKATSS